LCDGNPETSCPENLAGYFVLGKPSGETSGKNLGDISGAHTYSVATSSDYSHKHVSNHKHGGFTKTSHSHGNVSIPTKDGTTYTSSNTVPSTTSPVGVDGRSHTYTVCHDWGWSCETRWHIIYDEMVTGYGGPSTTNGNHKHPVTIDHGHTVSVSSDEHNHELAEKSHEHKNTAHDHSVDNEPVYYQLAFIYLKGEG
jgi:hypothetical protein